MDFIFLTLVCDRHFKNQRHVYDDHFYLVRFRERVKNTQKKKTTLFGSVSISTRHYVYLRNNEVRDCAGAGGGQLFVPFFRHPTPEPNYQSESDPSLTILSHDQASSNVNRICFYR